MKSVRFILTLGIALSAWSAHAGDPCDGYSRKAYAPPFRATSTVRATNDSGPDLFSPRGQKVGYSMTLTNVSSVAQSVRVVLDGLAGSMSMKRTPANENTNPYNSNWALVPDTGLWNIDLTYFSRSANVGPKGTLDTFWDLKIPPKDTRAVSVTFRCQLNSTPNCYTGTAGLVDASGMQGTKYKKDGFNFPPEAVKRIRVSTMFTFHVCVKENKGGIIATQQFETEGSGHQIQGSPGNVDVDGDPKDYSVDLNSGVAF